MKLLLRKIFDSIEGNGAPGLKTRTALIEADIKEVQKDINILPCSVRFDTCKEEFKEIHTKIKNVSDRLVSPKRIAIQATIITFSGFIGGFTAMWTIARFYLPDMIANKLPQIVKQILPDIIP